MKYLKRSLRWRTIEPEENLHDLLQKKTLVRLAKEIKL